MSHRDRSAEFENYNRVFIICSPSLSMSDIKDEFSPFGEIKDTYMVKDKRTKESKGIVYITYSKASEAALAIERMNGKYLGQSEKPLKVVLASSRSEGNVREADEDKKMCRLFILVPKTLTEDEIEEEFSKYGDVEAVHIVKDKMTHKPRGFAYVTFRRAYNAAIALETCPSDYKPVFATQRSKPSSDSRDSRSSMSEAGWSRREGRSDRRSDGMSRSRLSLTDEMMFAPPLPMRQLPPAVVPHASDALDKLRFYQNAGVSMVEATVMATVTKDQVRRLFSIVPGLEYFEYDQFTGQVCAEYSMPQLASYAVDKLNGFEYPSGCKLSVWLSRADARPKATMGSMGAGNIQELVATLQTVTASLQQAGVLGAGASAINQLMEPGGILPGGLEANCSVPIPPPCPTVLADTPVAKRLFIVCAEILPDSVLTDLFCRFGNLISAKLLKGRNHGYVKYASEASANHAIETLHLKEVYGGLIKVLEAEEPSNSGEKRGRSSDSRSGDWSSYEKMAKFS